MASNSRRQAATMAVARGSRLGRVASAGSATMMGIPAPSPWRSASASPSPANAPPPMTMLRCADMLNLTHGAHRLHLLHDYSWAKQVGEARALGPEIVIPGTRLRVNPESRDSGFEAVGLAPE